MLRGCRRTAEWVQEVLKVQDPRESGPSRRNVLQWGMGLAGMALGAQDGVHDPDRESSDPLDRALERLHASVSSNTHFLSNHVPMAVEALDALGRADAIESWVDAHLDPVESEGPAREPVQEEQWPSALGHRERFLDWRASFVTWLEEADWRDVLQLWTKRFLPGLAGAATHGLIRTAHATRALARRDVAIRRVELATALAYWASSYESLPWNGKVAAERSVDDALANVVLRLPSREPPRGNLVSGLRALGETPSFLPVAGLVDPRDPADLLSQITAAFAEVFLRNPERRLHFTHAITAPSALRLLAPHLDEETLVQGARYAWQAAAGLYVAYHDPRNELPSSTAAPDRETLISRAVENGDAHAIKLTEACLREDAISRDPRRLQAALDGAQAL